MSSGVYAQGMAELMGGNIDLVNDSLSVLLVDVGLYAPDFDNDTSQADIPEGSRIAEVLVTGKALDVTTLLADDATFSLLTSDLTVGGVVLFKDTGVFDTSTLIAFFDNAPEFPITPDGTDVVIAWTGGEVLSL